MARSLSWLDRTVPISRTVQESAQSHYDRKELQRLFELQLRAAQQLMAALPNISVGRARLVDREALSAFLERLRDSEKPAQTFALMLAMAHPLGEGKRRLWRFIEEEFLDWSEKLSEVQKRPPARSINSAIGARARRSA